VWAGLVFVVVMLATAALAISAGPSRRVLLQTLRAAATPARVGPAPTASYSLRSRAGYLVGLALTPNRASGPTTLSVHVVRDGRSLSGARVRVDLSMPSMNMWNAYAASLTASNGGRYLASIPALGMAGVWRLRVEVRPRSGREFWVAVNDRMTS
jgi:hypothetical protein